MRVNAVVVSIAVGVGVSLGCGGGVGTVSRGQTGTVEDSIGIPPAGYGTLEQRDVSLTFETGDVQLQIIPLDERIIRLLAPDTYRALSSLKTSHRRRLDSISTRLALGRGVPFLISFFALRERARFDPDGVTITALGRFYRPAAILPISPRWSQEELRQREVARAIYIYENGVNLFQPFAVSYLGTENRRWAELLRVIEQELTRVRLRAESDRTGR